MSTPEQQVSLPQAAADRFDNLFYSKSDEKFTVRSLLEEMLGQRRFERSLDVGPGAGHVSEPLAQRSKSLVLVEKSSEFEELLHQRFPEAKVIIAPVAEAELSGPFDVILFSHVLYYHPTEQWMALTRRLFDLLKPGGELIIAMNADSGDWWKIISDFRDELGPYIGFNYIPLSVFRRDLAALGAVKSIPYRYQMWIDPETSWSEFIGKQMLELTDDAVFADWSDRFAAFAKQFKQIDGSYVLDMRAELISLTRG